ncbi:MAG: AAA family ATPase [Planctomycetota bacterium]
MDRPTPEGPQEGQSEPRPPVQHSSRAACRVVALINQKGGVGKTTTTVNLAAGLAKLGRRALVVDLDPQAHATLHLGADPQELGASVYDVLNDPAQAEAAIRPVSDRLSLIGAETDLAAAETELAQADHRQHRLADALGRVNDRFDFVLLDCPPALGLLTINALTAASEVLIPMQAHFLALQGVGKLLESVQLVGQATNPGLRVSGVVLCAHDNQTAHGKEVVADMEDFFQQASGTGLPWAGARVFRPPVRRNIKLAECPSFGQTIFDYAPEAPGAADYWALAAALDAVRPEPATPAVPEPPVVETRPAEPSAHHAG